MKKIVAAILLLILGIAAFYLYSISKDRIGDLRPAFLPNSKNLADEISKGQRVGEKPSIPLTIPDGFTIGVFARDTTGARDLQFTEGGTLIATLMSRGEVIALPDKNNDGNSDEIKVLLSGLKRPHGLAFYNGKLFVAEENKVSRYNFNETTVTTAFEKKLFDLPTGGRHYSRSLTFDTKGNLYVSLGSTCDTCIEKNEFISTVLISDSDGNTPRVFSKGLRNAVFLAVKPGTDEVWTTEMGRDFLGDETPPDEINILSDGGNYGWPFCYGQGIVDKTQKEPTSTFCSSSKKPYYEIPAHSAPLGLTFIQSSQMDESIQGDLLVAYHGSWNRSTPTGYKIVKISTNGIPREEDFITGFIQGSNASGRPVDVEFDKAGSLYISDDKAGAVYKMIKTP